MKEATNLLFLLVEPKNCEVETKFCKKYDEEEENEKELSKEDVEENKDYSLGNFVFE